MGRTNDHSPSTSSAPVAKERERELLEAHRERKPQRYRSLLLHWFGRWMRRSKRANITPLPTVVPGQVGVSFSGHSTVLLRYANLNIVCDPMFGKWVKGVKRAVMPGLTPADLHDVDVILLSHSHADHLHRPTLAALPRSATVILPPRTAQYVSDLGFARVVELSEGQSLQDHGVDITTCPVRHGDAQNPALSYVIRGDGPSVYFCGDSGYFSGFADIGKKFAPDIALLPIGGYAPLSFRDRHMSPLDALYALEDLGARIMIPIHHGAFSLSYERLDEPRSWLTELVESRQLEDFVVPLEPGESRVFVPPKVQRTRDLQMSTSTIEVSGNQTSGAGAAEAAEPTVGASLFPDIGLVQALPAMRAAEVASNTPWTSEPLWTLEPSIELPRFEDMAPAPRPAFDLAMARQASEEVSLDGVPELVVGQEDAPIPVGLSMPIVFDMGEADVGLDGDTDPALPIPEFVIESISAVHSDPIELQPKVQAPDLQELVQAAVESLPAEPVSPDLVLSESLAPELLFPEDALDEIEHFVDESLQIAEQLQEEPLLPEVPARRPDADLGFNFRALLAEHFDRFPDSRLRARLAADTEREFERDNSRRRREPRLEPASALV